VKHQLRPRLFSRDDEVRVKLEAGTPARWPRVNKFVVPIEKILSNILLIDRRGAVIMQRPFPARHVPAPGAEEMVACAQRLQELTKAGAQIALVQIYSATRPTANLPCRTFAVAYPLPHRAGRAERDRIEDRNFLKD